MTTLFTSFVLAHPFVSALVVLVLLTAPVWLGVVVIGERQVGVVVKKFSNRALPVGRLIALDGEAGYQAETLRPACTSATGRGSTRRQGAGDGDPARRDRAGGRRRRQGHAGGAHPRRARATATTFQDAREFLTGGGEKGRQLGDPDRGHLPHQHGAVRRHHAGRRRPHTG